jgi:hypothetical protein
MADKSPIMDAVSNAATNPVTWIGAALGGVGLYFFGGGSMLNVVLGLLGGAVAGGAAAHFTGLGQPSQQVVKVPITQNRVPVQKGKPMELQLDTGNNSAIHVRGEASADGKTFEIKETGLSTNGAVH